MTVAPLFRCIAERADAAIALARAEPRDGSRLRFEWCNTAFSDVTGLSRSEVIGAPAQLLLESTADQSAQLSALEMLMRWEPFSVDILADGAEGRKGAHRATWYPVQDPDVDGSWWICSVSSLSGADTGAGDLSPKDQAPARPSLLDAAVTRLPHGFAVFDREGVLSAANPAFWTQFRYPRKGADKPQRYRDILDHGVRVGALAATIGSEEIDEAAGALTTLGPPQSLLLSDGRRVEAQHAIAPEGGRSVLILDTSATVSSAVEGIRLRNSIRALKEERRELLDEKTAIETASLIDPVTELASRPGLQAELERRVLQLTHREEAFGVFLINIDRFRVVNETFGHEAGDLLLRRVADVLRHEMSEGDFAARMGGDEFAIIASLTENAADVTALAERVLKAVDAPMAVGSRRLQISVTIGIAIATPDMDVPDNVLANADAALTRAKSRGRGSWSFFTDAMNRTALETRRIAGELLEACERNEMLVYYQPQMDAESHALVGLEALVRWRHPTRGILAPNAFLDVATKLGLLKDIDRMVFHRVAEDVRDWMAQGLHIPKVSVNVSAHRLHDPMLVRDIRGASIDPSVFCIEILESAYIDERDDRARWTCDALRELGCKIAIDDFGTGHASVQGLLAIGADHLKIDRQFIDPILDDSSKSDLARALVQIGRSLGIEVVAEGVETEAHARAAFEMGCNRLQGYHFGRPIPKDDITPMLSPAGSDGGLQFPRTTVPPSRVHPTILSG